MKLLNKKLNQRTEYDEFKDFRPFFNFIRNNPDIFLFIGLIALSMTVFFLSPAMWFTWDKELDIPVYSFHYSHLLPKLLQMLRDGQILATDIYGQLVPDYKVVSEEAELFKKNYELRVQETTLKIWGYEPIVYFVNPGYRAALEFYTRLHTHTTRIAVVLIHQEIFLRVFLQYQITFFIFGIDDPSLRYKLIFLFLWREENGMTVPEYPVMQLSKFLNPEWCELNYEWIDNHPSTPEILDYITTPFTFLPSAYNGMIYLIECINAFKADIDKFEIQYKEDLHRLYHSDKCKLTEEMLRKVDKLIASADKILGPELKTLENGMSIYENFKRYYSGDADFSTDIYFLEVICDPIERISTFPLIFQLLMTRDDYFIICQHHFLLYF
uniref:Uncharacterized protein n=1 Tax=Toxarium undulatum TaxID=210620 RepID=A0A2U9GIX4_9STRA|nr:hypothetical protein [Toxarium undulatum]AWQ64125.1 hypothetical protein [Toxarium undulatum]